MIIIMNDDDDETNTETNSENAHRLICLYMPYSQKANLPDFKNRTYSTITKAILTLKIL